MVRANQGRSTPSVVSLTRGNGDGLTGAGTEGRAEQQREDDACQSNAEWKEQERQRRTMQGRFWR